MQIEPGHRVLDAGCGPGVDSVPLAQRVGATGKVYALDSDAAMLAQAARHAAEQGVQDRIVHLHASARGLPLPEASVDGCRAERLLQVLPPGSGPAVISELVRVTRPGGRVVIADTDWGSASVDFSDSVLERKLLNFFATRMRPNGFAGRNAAALLRARQVSDLSVEVVPLMQQRLDDTPFGDWLTGTAVREQVITPDQAAAWRSELRRRETDGTLYLGVNMVVVAATRT
jgi:ubiquinone/menaquinone biosynthesis C-methylase UbiE